MIDIVIVPIYLVFILMVGLWTGGRPNNLEEYAVVGRSYGALVVFATMSASFIGGGFSIGNAAKVFLFGIANIIGLWGFSLKEILVARYIAPKFDRFPSAISVGDIMATAYGKIGRVITGMCAVFLCAGIVGAQVGAMGIVFNVFYGMDRLWGIAFGCGIVILYTALGGMRAVVVTDLFQFGVLAIGMPLVLIFGVNYVGGLDSLIAAVPPDHIAVDWPGSSRLAGVRLCNLNKVVKEDSGGADPRSFAPGLLYHVIVRGNHRETTFWKARDYRAYLERLGRYRVKHKVEIYAYCQMPNHTHLLLETCGPPLPNSCKGYNNRTRNISTASTRTWDISFRGGIKPSCVSGRSISWSWCAIFI